MAQLEDLPPSASVRGSLPDSLVTVVDVQWFGSAKVEPTYKSPDGKVADELLDRHDQPGWNSWLANWFDNWFDPVLPVQTSAVRRLGRL